MFGASRRPIRSLPEGSMLVRIDSIDVSMKIDESLDEKQDGNLPSLVGAMRGCL